MVMMVELMMGNLTGSREKPSGMRIADAVRLFPWLKSFRSINPKGFWSKFRICVNLGFAMPLMKSFIVAR